MRIRVAPRGQMEKLVPQPQDMVACGLLILKALADKVVDEIDLGAAHIDERDGIDQNGGAVPLDHQIVVMRVGRRA